jgi:hypothetical protein
VCRGVTARSPRWARASNTETDSRVFPDAKNPTKSQIIDFKGFLKVGTASAISTAQQKQKKQQALIKIRRNDSDITKTTRQRRS